MRTRAMVTAMTLGLCSGLAACNLISGVDEYSLTGAAGSAGKSGSAGAGAGGSGVTTGAAGVSGTGGVATEHGRVLWSRAYGSNLDDGVSALAVDKANRVVVAGFVSGDAEFHNASLKGPPGVYVARVDDSGQTADLRSFPTSVINNEMQPGMALKSDGNPVLGGVFLGDVDFGNGVVNAGVPRLFVTSLNGENNAQWVFTSGNGATFGTPHLAVDKEDNTFLFFDAKGGKVTFGANSYPVTNENAAYVAKLDASGDVLWSHQLHNASFVYAYAISLDPNDQSSVYVAGKADVGPLDCGCPDLLPVQSYGMFVVQYDGGGKCLRQLSYGGDTPPHSVVADVEGNLYIAGAHSLGFNVGAKVVEHSEGEPNFDAYVIKVDKMGDLVWSSSFGAPGKDADDDADEIWVADNGDVIVTGHISGTVDLGNGVVLAGATASDLFIARLAGATGDALWARRFTDLTALQVLYAHLAADPAGDLFVGGLFATSIDFGDADSPHPSAGGVDGYLVKLTGN